RRCRRAVDEPRARAAGDDGPEHRGGGPVSARIPRGGTPRDEVSRSEVPQALTEEGTGSATAGVTAPQSFRAAGVTAGLKPSGSPDLAVVVNDGPDQVGAA